MQFFDQKQIFTKIFSCIFFTFLVIKTLDLYPDPDSLEMLDPDLMNPDHKNCCKDAENKLNYQRAS